MHFFLKDEVKEMIEEADTDGDNKVSFNGIQMLLTFSLMNQLILFLLFFSFKQNPKLYKNSNRFFTKTNHQYDKVANLAKTHLNKLLYKFPIGYAYFKD
jgi:hypothetical protein